ncbi:hypothetical protein HUU62_17330 [Rhodoferax sp. 4810]|uniref:Uncharacterized protein n=1 Tax=Thiospirillum jenense TaxID=1653858 RepID=A0A839HA54_9GAMM|nr:hypothetical protein [Thiospirillum jenense]MBB1076169.1 hypothetical protein [Rhodoferax jenense]MBB1126045.1 hypothetical protein [Thiospirillum jenense]
MDINSLKPGAIIRGPIIPESIQVVVVTDIGASIQIQGKGLETGQFHDLFVTREQIKQITVTPDKRPFDGDAHRFQLGIEAMRLDTICQGQTLSGIVPSQTVRVMAAILIGQAALQLIYRIADGSIKDCLLDQTTAAAIHAVEECIAFNGDAAIFQLACEAKRISLAFLFDPMMAVHISNRVVLT